MLVIIAIDIAIAILCKSRASIVVSCCSRLPRLPPVSMAPPVSCSNANGSPRSEKLEAPSRPYNFSAGPAMLPDHVLGKMLNELGDFEELGMSILEMGHRQEDGPVQRVLQEATHAVRSLLKVPANYSILWQQGGAHGQFAAVPLNLLGDKVQADYVDTGVWSRKAMNEASKFCRTRVASTLVERNGHLCLPPVSELALSDDSAYVHLCANDTINGFEFLEDPDVGEKLLVADFTSTLLSRPVDVSR